MQAIFSAHYVTWEGLAGHTVLVEAAAEIQNQSLST